MRKSSALMMGLVAALGLAVLGGCSLYDGALYGSLSWNSGTYDLMVNSDFSSTSGMSSSAPLYPGSHFAMDEGSHYFVYFLVDKTTTPKSYTMPFYVSYTIERETGNESDRGDDKYFTVYCNASGPSYGTITYPRSVVGGDLPNLKADGVPVTIQEGGYKLTISVKPVALTEAEKASFISLGK